MNNLRMDKKILCGILAAGVLSIGGTDCVWAGESINDDNFVNGIISSNENYVIDSNQIENIFGTPRGYGIKLEKTAVNLVNLDNNSLIVKNKLDYSNNSQLDVNYGIIQLGNTNLIINGNLDMNVYGIGIRQVRGIHEMKNDAITINGNSNIVSVLDGNAGNINQAAPISPNNAYVAGVGVWDGSAVNFNGNTKITVSAINSIGSTWANALQNAGGTVNFYGNETDLSVTNDNYTAQTIITFRGNDGNGIIGGITNFNSKNTTNLTAKSNFGSNVIGFSTGVSYVNFNSKEVNLHAIITDGVGGTNAIGILGGDNVIVSSNVEKFNVIVEGAGVDNGNSGYSNGTAGIYESGGKTTVNSKKLNVNVISGEDTENTKFDKSQADALGDDYCTAYGLRADYSGHITIGKDTNAVIYAKDNYKNAIAVYAGDFNNGNIAPGSVEILGNATITAIGGKGTKALYAKNGGTITVGSEGKTVSLVGDVVADGNNSVINIAGDSVFNTENTEFTTANNGSINLAGGNMSGVLNISKDSIVNLNGATFTAANIADDITGGGKLVLKAAGVLSTTADQIFTNGESAVTAIGTVDGILGSTADKVTFESGTVSLNDAEYTLDFVNSAIDVMGKHAYEEGKSSNTGIVMTGSLVGELGENQITVDNAGALGNNAALDKVTVQAEGNLLVGTTVNTDIGTTTVENINIKDSVVNGFNVGSLDLKVDKGITAGMVITNDKNVTLGGSEGGNIITVNGEASDVKVVVGLNSGTTVDGVTNEKGSFTIGNALATSATEYNLNGSVTVNDSSKLTTNGQTTITKGVTLNGGNLDAASGALNADVAVKENTNNTITGTVNAGTLTGNAGAVINVGTADKTASTSIKDANLNGAIICFDPDWDQEAGTHGIAFTKAENGKTVTDVVDGKVLVARNNYVGVGTADSQAAKKMFAKTGLTFGKDDITAVLYIAGNQTLDDTNGAIVVDGSKAGAGDFGTVEGGNFTAAANSVTMVDGQSIKDTAALSGVKTSSFIDGAKLYIDNAKKGETYKVINGVDTGWADSNIISDNSLLVFAGDTNADNAFNVTASYDKVDNVYGESAVVIADVVDKTLEVGKDGDAAYDFFNAAASSKNNATKDAQAAAFNSAANMGEMGGVNHAAYSVSNAMTDAVADHLSIATHGDQDKDIWAHYVHNKENIENIRLGGLSAGYDLQYNGIVVGSDLYKKGKATAGIALSYIEGDVTNSNIASYTKNEAEYYGASVYGRIDNGNSAVLGDITYMHGSCDISQNNSGYKLTADADTDVFSIGVRAEQKIEAGIGQFVPYAGLRYMHLGTGNYANSIGMNYDVDEQNLWLLPVGVTYSCEAQKGGWTIRPVVEAGYVWAMGDRDTNQTVSLNGAANGFGFDTADSGSFVSRFAVEAERANIVYSLGYEYQKGDTVKANKWMANMTWKF